MGTTRRRMALAGLALAAALAIGCADDPGPRSSREYPVREGDCLVVYLSESGKAIEGRLIRIGSSGGYETYHIEPFGQPGGDVMVKVGRKYIDAAGALPCREVK